MKNEKLRVKGIILDLDGTLVDSKQAYLEAARKAFSAFGQKTFDISVVTEIPKRFEEHSPLDDLLPGINAQKFAETYLKAYYRAASTKAKPFPDVALTLRRLNEKAKLAMITQRCISMQKIVDQLEKFGIAEHFQVVLTGIDMSNPKPSPEGLIQCSKKLDVRTYDCAMVGDSVVDIQAGRNAGAITVAVLSGIFSFEELQKQKPDLILENVTKLPDSLE